MKTNRVFSQSKMEAHPDRVRDYLNGKQIYPITMELDTTQVCNRSCPACPHAVSSQVARRTLDMKFLDRLFGIMGPHTPGLLLTGGEPTLVPHFGETLRLAKKTGFEDVAVISNGSYLDQPRVRQALMEHATAIRVSQYDWQQEDSEAFLETLARIERFRRRVETEGSPIHISVSILTRREWIGRLLPVARRALDAGVHWVYFHPFISWDTHNPVLTDQQGVLDELRRIQTLLPEGNIQYPAERYEPEALRFDKLHGSFFLFQLGADKISYAGTDCKYEPDYAVLDLNENFDENFLWHPKRVAFLSSINDRNYRHLEVKHRPSVFSHYIQQIIDNRIPFDGDADASMQAYAYPSII